MGGEEVKLLGRSTSPYSRRVEIALRIKGIQYEYIEQDLKNKSQLLLQSNPVYKSIPVLLHNGNPIVHHQIILEYIDETWKSNPILPQDPYDRATARFWCRFIDEKVTLPGRQTVLAMPGEARERAEKLDKEKLESLKTLEKQLEGKKFFGGDKFGIVDITAMGLTAWSLALQEASGMEFVTAENFPLIFRWAEEFLSCGVIKENLPSKEQLVAVFKADIQAVAAKKQGKKAYMANEEEEVKLLGTWMSLYSRRVEIALKLKGDLKNKSDLLIQSNPVHRSPAQRQINCRISDHPRIHRRNLQIQSHFASRSLRSRLRALLVQIHRRKGGVTPPGGKAMMAFLGEEREKAEKEAAENPREAVGREEILRRGEVWGGGHSGNRDCGVDCGVPGSGGEGVHDGGEIPVDLEVGGGDSEGESAFEGAVGWCLQGSPSSHGRRSQGGVNQMPTSEIAFLGVRRTPFLDMVENSIMATIIISFQVPSLKAKNYHYNNWSIKLKVLLGAHDIWDVVENGVRVVEDETTLTATERDQLKEEQRKKD
ncbi:hypothetical protein V2J09_010494 [Rumex salicifolius]